MARMNELTINTALIILVLSLGGGMIRVVRGPTRADRLLAAQLFGSCGVALLLLLSQGMKMPALIDAALVLTLLAAVASFTFARVVWGYGKTESESTDGVE
jgi:multicomponent Na+:H+ antiporter subunit F